MGRGGGYVSQEITLFPATLAENIAPDWSSIQIPKRLSLLPKQLVCINL